MSQHRFLDTGFKSDTKQCRSRASFSCNRILLHSTLPRDVTYPDGYPCSEDDLQIDRFLKLNTGMFVRFKWLMLVSTLPVPMERYQSFCRRALQRNRALRRARHQMWERRGDGS